MSMESAAGRSTTQRAIDRDWEHPTPPTDLIFDDGEPLESARHRIAMNVLIASAIAALGDRPNSFVGGNMFVYYSRNQAMNRDFRGPDFFVALEVDGTKERQGWVTWEEDGRYPDVIVELLSPSTAQVDRTTKKDLYERVFRTADYYVFDPFEPSAFEGWHLTNQRYQALEPNAQGQLWCEALGLWLGTWTGSVQREPPTGTCEWLRFYDAQGSLILLPEEQARSRAEQAEAQLIQERDRVREQLRARGIDPDEVLG
ncbi:Uma2 family endonuclease [Microcoleus sp. FACHB-1515]|uniref:Uma2 family endonuclease n=1 Tax=Cyanophyceae TaxID=3028117 RepID=UPI001687DF96|nr:Uma2 family endonuclease [Microcoleus sp. FACHB-1515]MBD2090646.1 Uma2 family endonuclease [Microcoleus sp. FACHB-1515]